MGVIDDIKSIAKIINQMDNIELYQKVLDLQADIVEMQENINSLKEKNKDLKDKIKIKGLLKFKNSAYWLTDKQGNIRDGPFCTRCWDKDMNRIRLLPRGLSKNAMDCPECKILIVNPELFNNST